MKPLLFGLADEVVYVGDDRFWKVGETHYIQEMVLNGPTIDDVSYATDRGAWFKGSDFELVRHASKTTLKKLWKLMEDE